MTWLITVAILLAVFSINMIDSYDSDYSAQLSTTLTRKWVERPGVEIEGSDEKWTTTTMAWKMTTKRCAENCLSEPWCTSIEQWDKVYCSLNARTLIEAKDEEVNTNTNATMYELQFWVRPDKAKFYDDVDVPVLFSGQKNSQEDCESECLANRACLSFAYNAEMECKTYSKSRQLEESLNHGALEYDEDTFFSERIFFTRTIGHRLDVGKGEKVVFPGKNDVYCRKRCHESMSCRAYMTSTLSENGEVCTILRRGRYRAGNNGVTIDDAVEDIRYTLFDKVGPLTKLWTTPAPPPYTQADAELEKQYVAKL